MIQKMKSFLSTVVRFILNKSLFYLLIFGDTKPLVFDFLFIVTVIPLLSLMLVLSLSIFIPATFFQGIITIFISGLVFIYLCWILKNIASSVLKYNNIKTELINIHTNMIFSLLIEKSSSFDVLVLQNRLGIIRSWPLIPAPLLIKFSPLLSLFLSVISLVITQ